MAKWQDIFEKLDDWRWKIPRTFKAGMRTDVVIYSSEEMLEHIVSDNAHLQAVNVAFLPGIVGNSLAMPDIHLGYGFPIGGVAAFDPEADGIVSPGGVGYDINCLSADSQVLHEFGYKMPIKEFKKRWRAERIKCLKLNPGKPVNAEMIRFLELPVKNRVYRVLTESGQAVSATEDHPFYTSSGMTPLKNINDSPVALYPFEGIEYKSPSAAVIINEADIFEECRRLGKGASGNAWSQIKKQLIAKRCLPIKQNGAITPYLLKIMGFVFGDGSLVFSKGKGYVWFYGRESDLEAIREDIIRIGFKPSRIYLRDKSCRISSKYGTYRFVHREASFKVVSTSFAVLLAALGVPCGNKAAQSYAVPEWIYSLPLWQKRLFLAALFGAGLTSPKTLTGHKYNFYQPALSMNKKEKHLKSGIKFMQSIKLLLKEFEIKTAKISQDKHQGYRVRLLVSANFDSLHNLWGRIGYEYQAEKMFLANLAVHYLLYKEAAVKSREWMSYCIRNLRQEGFSAGRIKEIFLKKRIANERFVERSIWEGRKTAPRIPANFPGFKEFIAQKTAGLGTSGMVWDKIIARWEVKEKLVYDFTVAHEDHNFIANKFVVSNCGVRVLRTDLTHDEIKPKIRDIVSRLATNVPSGVGSEGPLSLSSRDLDKLLVDGAQWAVSHGYGEPNDIEHTEERGALAGADPSLVSEHAKERGTSQQGTLGSGNHFLEVQFVEEIYDEKVAAEFGLFKDQVTIMVHSGSRGLGHQVCTDYIKMMNQSMHKYNIQVPDRQLCCAPINSPEGKDYLAAMAAAANFAWANRQMLMHWTRESFSQALQSSPKKLGISLIYDVAHNIAKMEKHRVNGKEKTVCVHRKGATRSFPGQPVLIPGDMGRYSYVLVGTEQAMKESWGSTCHGAGRLMSRAAATRAVSVNQLLADLEKKGIIVMAASKKGLVEEASEAYKDVREVVDVVHNAGLAKKVARMRPLGVVKG